MAARALRIGVAGLGTVGSETVRLLRARAADLAGRLGASPEVTAVCDRRIAAIAPGLGLGPGVRRLRRPADLLKEPLDIVVELMGGTGDARRLVLGALRSGRRVATANKQLLALHFDELRAAALEGGASLAFEASVAGGIPVIQAVRQSLAANRIRGVLGILNGTTNYVLTRMAHDGLELDAAVAEARRLGLAERDPRMDLDGTDAAYKVSLLASLVAGGWVRPADVPTEGILSVTAEDIRFAVNELGRAVRLLGVVDVDWGRGAVAVSAAVRPVLVPMKHPLASVHGEYNAVLLRASAAGDLMFYGKGAGAGPAASAVAGDVFMLCQEALGRRVPEPAAVLPGRTVRVVPERGAAAFYLRLRVKDRPGVLSRITGALGRNGVSIARICQDAAPGAPDAASVFLLTHAAAEVRFARARQAILAMPFVCGPATALRLL